MKLVLYSNIVVAAFSTYGICHSLLEHCLYNHTIFFSEDLLNEISIKLKVKIEIPKQLVKEIITFLKIHARMVSPQTLEQRICQDLNLDNVISLAITAKSDYIISGEHDLFILKQDKSVPIICVRDFWNILQNKDK